jgi:hypothetical protein
MGTPGEATARRFRSSSCKVFADEAIAAAVNFTFFPLPLAPVGRARHRTEWPFDQLGPPGSPPAHPSCPLDPWGTDPTKWDVHHAGLAPACTPGTGCRLGVPEDHLGAACVPSK